jgi:hypothetical protein
VSQGPATVYVYGVMQAAAGDAASAVGVEGCKVRAVRHAGLAALVSDLEGASLSAAREVRAHWRVLEEASEEATVVPVRFGTVMEGERAVEEQLLEPNAERLSALLQQLEGRVQLSVKGDYDEGQLIRDVVARAPEISALRDRLRTLPEAAGYYDRIRMGELVAAGVDRRREEDRSLALGALGPLAEDSRAEDVGGSEAAFNLAFLVDRERLEPFSAAVAELAGEFGERIRIRYVGPLPPYSFADVELGAGSAAWA